MHLGFLEPNDSSPTTARSDGSSPPKERQGRGRCRGHGRESHMTNQFQAFEQSKDLLARRTLDHTSHPTTHMRHTGDQCPSNSSGIRSKITHAIPVLPATIYTNETARIRMILQRRSASTPGEIGRMRIEYAHSLGARAFGKLFAVRSRAERPETSAVTPSAPRRTNSMKYRRNIGERSTSHFRTKATNLLFSPGSSCAHQAIPSYAHSPPSQPPCFVSHELVALRNGTFAVDHRAIASPWQRCARRGGRHSRASTERVPHYVAYEDTQSSRAGASRRWRSK